MTMMTTTTTRSGNKQQQQQYRSSSSSGGTTTTIIGYKHLIKFVIFGIILVLIQQIQLMLIANNKSPTTTKTKIIIEYSRNDFLHENKEDIIIEKQQKLNHRQLQNDNNEDMIITTTKQTIPQQPPHAATKTTTKTKTTTAAANLRRSESSSSSTKNDNNSKQAIISPPKQQQPSNNNNIVENPCPKNAIWDDNFRNYFLSMKHILEQLGLPFWVSDASLIGTLRYGGITGCHYSNSDSNDNDNDNDNNNNNSRVCYEMDDDLDWFILNQPIQNITQDLPIKINNKLEATIIREQIEGIILNMGPHDNDNNNNNNNINNNNPWYNSSKCTNNHVRIRCEIKKNSQKEPIFYTDIHLNHPLNDIRKGKVIYRSRFPYQLWGHKIPYELIFPLKHGAFYGETVNVPNQYMNVLEKWKFMEYGNYCNQIITDEPPYGLNNTSSMTLMKQDIQVCSENLHKQGLASFYECFQQQQEQEQEQPKQE